MNFSPFFSILSKAVLLFSHVTLTQEEVIDVSHRGQGTCLGMREVCFSCDVSKGLPGKRVLVT